MADTPSNQTDSFLTGTNALYVAEMYARFMDGSGELDPSWANFFAIVR